MWDGKPRFHHYPPNKQSHIYLVPAMSIKIFDTKTNLFFLRMYIVKKKNNNYSNDFLASNFSLSLSVILNNETLRITNI